MNERVTAGVRTVGAAVLTAVFFACAPQMAQAQTTVVLDAPGSESIDTTVRGGSYASANYGTAPLVTRASGDLSYVRRAMMKFNTETPIPAKSAIVSARLTLTVKAGNSEARRLAAYRIVYSFDEGVANWNRRKSGIEWSRAGGDFGSKYAEATVGSSVGSKVTFDVTRLVQEAVNGNYGSRWTRIAVIDPGSSSRESWREYYSSETSTASLRPTLTVVYGGSGSTTTSGTSGTTGSTTSTSLPSGWSSRDVGSVGRTGRAGGTTSSLTVEGAGADVWGRSDAFRFAYRTLSGDGSIVTRVAGLERVNSWTKAGVMMRESLASNSRHAFMLVSPGKGLAFQRRTSTGGSSYHTSGGSGVAPYWVKLTRSGSTFTAYKSTNGTSWTRVGSQSISMASTIYVGLAVSSHVSGTLATGSFASTSVTAGGVTSSPAPSTSEPAPEPAPAPAPAPSESTSGSTGSTLRILHWNVHHGGIGTDGRYDPARIGSWIAKMNPHIASLNEVDTTSQVSAIVSALQSRSGVRWYTYFSGRGNLVISRIALDDTSKCLYAPSYSAYAPHLNIVFNGRRISLWSAHLHVSSASSRLAETKALQSCAGGWAEARIIAGDYNMQYGSTEYKQAATNYTDAWLAAKALSATTNYSGNCDGCTRNSRIDYIFSSKGASFLRVKSAQVVDTRDSNGKMASDHKPLLVNYTVN